MVNDFDVVADIGPIRDLTLNKITRILQNRKGYGNLIIYVVKPLIFLQEITIEGTREVFQTGGK